MKVYVSRHRMSDIDDGWEITQLSDVDIQIDKELLFSLFEGYYEENFYLQISTYNANVLRKLKQRAKVGDHLYIGFWSEDENRLFQVQMLFQESGRRKKYKIPATLTYVIDGFPEIFPLSCREGKSRVENQKRKTG